MLIGINYFGQKGQLRGCINDVKNMSKFLHDRFQYKWDDMVILTDDQQHPKSQPTKQNILAAMHWLVKDAQPNDSLFFHYSGHGGQTKDLDGDEGDGYDETIYPLDFRYTGHIVDDEMHRIMFVPLLVISGEQALTKLQGAAVEAWSTTYRYFRLLPLRISTRLAILVLDLRKAEGAQPCPGGWYGTIRSSSGLL